MKGLRTLVAGSLLCFGLLSCGTTVVARRMLPARYDITNIETIAVNRFLAFDEEEKETARRLTSSVEERLQETGFFRVIRSADQDAITVQEEKRPRTKRTLSWLEAWRQYGEHNQAQAVFGGEIDLARVRTLPGKTPEKEAAIVLTLHLLDVSTGKLRNGGRLVERETWESGASDELMATVIRRMAERVVDQITPRTVVQKLTLAADKPCAEGIALARENQWAAAISSWQQVMVTHRNHHAALYNIGAANEFLGSYDQALGFYKAAKAVLNRPLYAQALKRITALINEEEKRRQATALPIAPEAESQKVSPPTPESEEE